MLASPAIAPTLNAAEIVPDPKSQFGPPAAAVQVQNASPFVLQVTIDGSQNVIQSFTAQTFDTDGSGTSLVFVPTAGPAGTQGSVTCVWLALNEDPPMTDGQLTGAAQYAVGLGVLLAQGNTPNSGLVGNVNLPPTVRTLLIACYVATGTITDVDVIGGVTGISWYGAGPTAFGGLQPPYLKIPGTSYYLVVVPIPSVIDTFITVTFSTSAGVPVLYEIVGDTALYQESEFYNGLPASTAATSAVAGNTTLVTGPCRLLSAATWSNAANGSSAITLSAEGRLIGQWNGSGATTFPGSGLIVPTGESVIFQNIANISATGSVVSAYP